MRVDFYVLPDAVPDGLLRLACRLTEKAWGVGHPVYLHAPSVAVAQRVDDLLWSFRQGSFVPHARLQDALPPTPPILIGEGVGPGAEGLEPALLAQMHTLLRSPNPSPSPPWEVSPVPGSLLVNLCPAVPQFFGGFERIIELVDQAPDNLRMGRSRFAFYRQQGITPESHNLTSAAG